MIVQRIVIITNNFLSFSKTHNDYNLSILELIIIKTFRPNLCRKQYVYKSNLYRLFSKFFVAYWNILINYFNLIYVRILTFVNLLINSYLCNNKLLLHL